MPPREGQGPETSDDAESRVPLGFDNRPPSALGPVADLGFRMAILSKAGQQAAADEIYRKLTGKEPPRMSE